MIVALMNERTREPVAKTVEIAATRATRRRGLLGRDGMDESTALVLAPCAAVHTVGMRFPIDVVFVDRQGFAVKVVRNLRPWRIALAASGNAVIEMPAGSLRWGQVLLGDRLYLAPAPGDQRSGQAADVAASAGTRFARDVSPPGGFMRRLRDTAGTSIVEAAIITPLLLLLTFSIVDFAVLFYAYLALENGVSQASRYGVTGNVMNDPLHPTTTLSRVDSIKLAMRQATPTLTLADSAFSFSHMSPGGNSWSGGTGAPSDIDRVTVDYTWNLMTPLLWPFFPGGQVHLKVDSAMKNEALFQ